MSREELLDQAKKLATPEGLLALSNNITPVTIVKGLQPVTEQQLVSSLHVGKPVVDRKPTVVQDMLGFSGDHVLFTIAPVYFMLSVPFDITGHFKFSEWGSDAHILKLTTTNKVTDIPGWTHTLEAVNKDSWDKFTQFMGELMFKKGDSYWSICGDTVTLPGPTPITVAVFTPRTANMRFITWVDDTGAIQFTMSSTEDAGAVPGKLNLLRGISE